MRMFEIDHRIRKSLKELANGCLNSLRLIRQIQNGHHENTKVIISLSIIEIETRLNQCFLDQEMQ